MTAVAAAAILASNGYHIQGGQKQFLLHVCGVVTLEESGCCCDDSPKDINVLFFAFPNEIEIGFFFPPFFA